MKYIINKNKNFNINKLIFNDIIRCFPQCCQAKGHRETGFCGRSLESLIILTKPKTGNFEPSKLYVIQDIHVSDETKLRMNERVSRSELQGIVKSENDSPGQYSYWQGRLRNVLESDTRLEIHASFNARLRSWDYDWNSNRWRGEKLHVAQIYVLFEVEPNVLEVIGTVVGPEFQITSNKTQSMRNKMDKALQEAAAAGLLDGQFTSSSLAGLNPLKKQKLMAFSQDSRDLMKNMTSATSPYLEYLNAATACLRNRIGVRAPVDQDMRTFSSSSSSATTSASAFSVMAAVGAGAEGFMATAPATSTTATATTAGGAVALPRVDRSNLTLQAKSLRDSMTLEDVSHVLMSLKSSGSGQMYSTANLINPSAYMFDVNRLLELQQGMQSPSGTTSVSGGSTKQAASVPESKPVSSSTVTITTSSTATNTTVEEVSSSSSTSVAAAAVATGASESTEC